MRASLPRSLFGQIMLSQLLLVAVIAVSLPLLLSHLLQGTADKYVAGRLGRDALSIAAIQHRVGTLNHPPPPFSGHLPRGRRFAVFDGHGVLQMQGPHALPLPFSMIAHGPEPIFFPHGNYDILSMPIAAPVNGRRLWVVVAQDRTVPDEIVDDVVEAFLIRTAWVIPVSLLASALIGLAVVRRVTGKFRRAAAAADAISVHRIDVRIDAAELPVEAKPLVTAANRAFDRLEAGYRFQSEFVGNVAHELRTPLALISLRVEGLDPSPERDLIQVGIERANHVVRQLMELAAIDRHYPALEAIDPCALARDVVSLMAPLVFRSGHDIAFVEPAAGSVRVEGVPGLVQIALGNLIDNAIRHTPAGCTITVSVSDRGVITVEDDGPGLAVREREGQQRQYRREGTNRSDSAGLGMSIVERIMAVCGGRFEAGNRAEGGAKVAIRLMVIA